jgi:hypothetical protein
MYDFAENLSFKNARSERVKGHGFIFRYHGLTKQIGTRMLMAGGYPIFVCGRATCCG